MSEAPYEVAILGAGIAGCALAYHLTRRNVGRILVYDPRTPAAGATGRAAGVVTEQLWDRWDVDVARESHREYAELCLRWDPTAYVRNGFLRWTADPIAEPVVWEMRERLKGWGVDVEEIAPSELERWVPAGHFEDVRATLFSRHDACVTPSSVATIYAEAARQSGAEFHFGQSLAGLSGGGRYVLDSGGRSFVARRLVVAAGAWSKKILNSLGHPLPLMPYRTQAALLRPPQPPSPTMPTIHDIDLDIYLRPEGPGRLLGGNGTERLETDPERFDASGDDRFLTHLGESLAQRLPGWSDCEVISAWAGVCTATYDRHPLVGPVPNVAGLYVMAGFNGFGIMRAGGIARRLADLIADGDDSDSGRAGLGPAWPGRFVRDPGPFLPRPGFTLEAGDDPRF